MTGSVVILDVGKTHAKLSLFGADGALRDHSVHANARAADGAAADGAAAGEAAQLDISGIAAWLTQSLVGFGAHGPIAAIVPVAHGAAGVLMDGDRAVAALDYEAEPPADMAAAYDAQRDPFAQTLSPRLPGGLNLGAQLFWLEQLFPDLWPGGGRVLLWPQFWAWWLSGEAASELTSLGCHSDLWRPEAAGYSELAERRGWASRLPPLRAAADAIGSLRPSLRAEIGIDGPAAVLCGLHDSNAALFATACQPELAGGPFTVVSTGTWFICMQSGGHRPFAYDPAEDMLANVDVHGRVTPTARFMGGRLYQQAMGEALGGPAEPALVRLVAADLAARTQHALGLIGATGPLVIEGRFAEDRAFIAALAALAPDRPIYASPSVDGVRLGGLRLALPGLPVAPLMRIDQP